MQGEIFDGHVRRKRINLDVLISQPFLDQRDTGYPHIDAIAKTVENQRHLTISRSGASYAGGAFSKTSSPSANETHDCLLRVQMCRVGRSHDVSSSVPARIHATRSLRGLATQDTHAGQTHHAFT